MIAIAIARGIAARLDGTHDQIWASFWVQLETSVSVIMVSTMIFKTLFAGKKNPPANKNSRRSRIYLWKRKQTPQLSDIETGATMTGMRTMIRENGRMTVGSFGKDESQSTVDSRCWERSDDDSVSADENQAQSASSKPSMTYQARWEGRNLHTAL